MKLKRPVIIIFMLLGLLVGMVAGCKTQTESEIYVDDTGREVSIEEMPQRLVSFGPSITEILFALGLDERVVGVCDYPFAIIFYYFFIPIDNHHKWNPIGSENHNSK